MLTLRVVIILSLLHRIFSKPFDDDSASIHQAVLASFYTFHSTGIYPCDTIVPENVILSMVQEHSIAKANQGILNHTGIQITSSFVDTCDNASVALQKAVGIIGTSRGFCESPTSEEVNDQYLIAATGVFRGEIGDSINYLLRAFCLPVIASATSSAEMDNPANYPYFLRTGASEIYKAQVIFDILQSQQWYHIIVIYDSSSAGMALNNAFKALVEYCSTDDDLNVYHGICVENYFQLSYTDGNEAELNTQLQTLSNNLKLSATRVIVMLMEERAIERTLLRFDFEAYSTGDWQLILPSTYIQYSVLLEYAFAIEEDVMEYDPLNEIVNITLENVDEEHDWIISLIKNQNLCCLSNETKCVYSFICDGTETIRYIPDKAKNEAIHVYNAIMLLATAIADIHDENCNGTQGYCGDMVKEVTGEILLEHLLSAKFEDDFGKSFKLFNRSALPVYNVYQMQNKNWSRVLTQYNPFEGPNPNAQNNEVKEIPIFEDIRRESLGCQPTCSMKEILDMRGRCCWECRSCGFGEFINRSLLMCQNCSIGERPNEFTNSCVSEPPQPLFYEPTAEMWVLVGVCVLGIMLTIAMTSYIYHFRTTPMVMASTPDLCYLQSLAQISLFITSGFMLPSSSMVLCAAVWTVSTVLLVATHAIFLIKAIRLSRPKFYTKLISYANTPVKSSMVMLVIIFISQLLISVIWVMLRPPTVQRHLHEEMVHCSSNNEVQTIVLMILPLALIFSTFYFQRNAIRNKIMFQVRQARLGLAGTLCFIVNYGVLLPLIFMEDSPSFVRATILMCIPLLTALVSLTTMHLPICYELFFRKKQNSHEYVSRERSRQFQAGNFVYYVDAMLLHRANRTRTQTTVNSA